MGLLDKAREKATQIAEQAKDKIDDVKEKRKADELLDDLGRILYRQRTERAETTDEAEIARLVAELRALEDEGTVVLPVVADGQAGEPESDATPTEITPD